MVEWGEKTEEDTEERKSVLMFYSSFRSANRTGTITFEMISLF